MTHVAPLVQLPGFAPIYLGLNVVKLQAATSPVTTLIKMVFAMTIGPDKPKAQARPVFKARKIKGNDTKYHRLLALPQ